jgi:serine/threonine protein kinase/pimeloyl-ACP methyl ester carboxylesterase
MDQKRWQKIEKIFTTALKMEQDKREKFLNETCVGDESLREEVKSLLIHDEQAGNLLEEPAMVLAARKFELDLSISETLNTSPSLIGKTLSHYQIVEILGKGGMGEVYLAHDSRLGRDVAIKTLTPGFTLNPDRLAHFRREAHTLASLNHPNIAAIYGLEEFEGEDYLVLELVEGNTLIGPLPLTQTLDYACQVTEALEAAHKRGIIHRDLKPANIKVTPQGRVKVLDFGLAKAIWGTEDMPDQKQPVTVIDSVCWQIAGTPAYMSPEQASGKEVDQRTDVWAFGCLLYELLTGKRAFKGDTISDTIKAILHDEPDWHALPAGTPVKLIRLMEQCLYKDINHRLKSITEARLTLEQLRKKLNSRRFLKYAKKPIFAIPAAIVTLLLLFLGVRMYQHNSKVRWVREQVIPEISRLLDAYEFDNAFRMIRRARAILPDDPTLQQIHQKISMPTPLITNPPGADVWATGYNPDDNDWLFLGTTPFTSQELPWGHYRLRIEKQGFRTIFGSGEVHGGKPLEFVLDLENTLPPEMVRVPGGYVGVSGLDGVKLNAFLIDRYEVTNQQFKEFINNGGYQRQWYWKQDFIQNDSEITFEEAIKLFCDSTGQPGPATWSHGNYPEGHDDYPVNGVSWYEAAAYAEYAGKQLPTIYHWQKAANPGFFADIAVLSNYGDKGQAQVGSYQGICPFGTLDMAGNVREWCFNEIEGKRITRGGAWNEPDWMFSDLDTRSPWDRSEKNGIRCVRYDVDNESVLQKPVKSPIHDYRKDTPVSEEVFQSYRSRYAYDQVDLDSRVEGIDEENSDWKREKVSFAAAYGNERILGYFYIPKHATPPYQTIIYAEPGMAFRLRSFQPAQEYFFSFLIKNGRAVLVPVLKGQYQRQYETMAAGPNESRDRVILWSKDFRRSIDYLVSRPDVDSDKIGVYGLSMGAGMLPVLAVDENRLKAAALASVGLYFDSNRLPEIDPFNFLTHFQVPTLMMNGRSDFDFPIETSVDPMFQLLGAAEKDKRQLFWNGGHGDLKEAREVVQEILVWFDRYLGPVKQVK